MNDDDPTTSPSIPSLSYEKSSNDDAATVNNNNGGAGKMKRERTANCRSHPYDLASVTDGVQLLRADLSQQLCNTIYAEMTETSGELSSNNDGHSMDQLRSAFSGHDMVLECADGYKIGVNRAFLAENSHYFNVAFNGPFKPVHGIHQLKSIPYLPLNNTLMFLEQLKTNQLSDLFSNSEAAPMELKTSLEILNTATYLQMDEVIEIIAKIIYQSVTISHLIAIQRHTTICCPQLGNQLWQLMTWKFDYLVTSGYFLELKEDELLGLLKEPALNLDIREEDKVINQWLTVNDKEETAVKLRERWQIASFSEFGMLGRPRTPTSIVLAHSGWSSSGPTNIVEAFDKHRRSWIHLKGLSRKNQPRAYHSLVATSTHLYSVGGFNGVDYYDSMHRLDLRKSLDNWEEVRPMGEKRCYLSTALLDEDHLLAIGGYDSEVRFRTSEMYTVSKNIWEPISTMNSVRSDAHSVVVDGNVYVVGGFDGINCHRTVEQYVPERNEWLMINPMLHTRSGVKAVHCEGVIMVVGGFDGRRRLRKCEFYDPRTGSWYKLASMQTTRSNFGIEMFNSEVIVAGGYEGRTIVDQVESYDWRCNSWLPVPALSLPRSALYLHTIEGLDLCQKFLNMEDIESISSTQYLDSTQ